MMIRNKHADADLKAIYPKMMRRSTSLTLFLMVGLAILFPDMKIDSKPTKRSIEVVNVVDIPVIPDPPLPLERPKIPLETEDEDVPDDVTIADTELDFDAPVVDIPPPLQKGDVEVEEEILEFWIVEQKPELIKFVNPVYPEMARRAGLQGQVLVAFIVTREGRVTEPRVLKGPEIFRAAALEAVRQFQFKPAMQNDRGVAVRMTIPIRFSLH
ncbi:MAG: energy transducer TonB [Gemmatimonadetes bacterium]|nr:energy transducer TonB [Gemmatimonadota bacterium]MYK53953.1 energy transducer TonB [Gemmatimonadota bacterium]